MTQVLALAMPFFGIILIGFLAGKLARLPRAGLAWLDFYLIYVALPALFFDILSRTPLHELARGSFALATTTSTFVTFMIALLVGRALTGAGMRIAALQGLIGSYANVGYMGPALTLSALGSAAAAPTALIFCFDVVLIVTLRRRPQGSFSSLLRRSPPWCPSSSEFFEGRFDGWNVYCGWVVGFDTPPFADFLVALMVGIGQRLSRFHESPWTATILGRTGS